MEISGADAIKVMGGIAMTFGSVAPAVAIGWVVREAMKSIGRNPEAAGDIRTTMILGAGLCEAVAIYVLLIAIILALVAG
jgi:F-type H+-transporting ATPase subunit c